MSNRKQRRQASAMPIAVPEPPPRIVYCSFCGKSQHEVFQMIAGPVLTAICDECVEECVNIVERKRAEQRDREGIAS